MIWIRSTHIQLESLGDRFNFRRASDSKQTRSQNRGASHRNRFVNDSRLQDRSSHAQGVGVSELTFKEMCRFPASLTHEWVQAQHEDANFSGSSGSPRCCRDGGGAGDGWNGDRHGRPPTRLKRFGGANVQEVPTTLNHRYGGNGTIAQPRRQGDRFGHTSVTSCTARWFR